MISYPEGTVGWLKYAGSNAWFLVEVKCRKAGSYTYGVRRSRTDFTIGPRDLLVVVGVPRV